MVAHYDTLDEIFDLDWDRMPAHTTIREIIQGTSGTELEQSFRQYSQELAQSDNKKQFIGCDGKVLRGSFDHFNDHKAIQILSAFVTNSRLILAHEEIATKTNEIPMAQALMEKLGLSGDIFTCDALHCQQKTLETAKATHNDVIVQVKSNQKRLLNDCQTLAETTTPAEIYQEPVTKTRNRIESRRAVVITINGIRFGFVSLGEIEQMAFAGEDQPGIAVLNDENITSSIESARRVSDVVIAMPHWGPEDAATPTWPQRELAIKLVEAGADVVVGNHTHLVQGIQQIDGVPVFYGLGNFVFDQGLRDHRQGAILLLSFEDDRYLGYEIIPTHVDPDGRVHIAGPEEAEEILSRIDAASEAFR